MLSNYRGISATNTISRLGLYGKLVKAGIESHYDNIEEQNGFCAGQFCIDNIFTVKQLLEKKNDNYVETHIPQEDIQHCSTK